MCFFLGILSTRSLVRSWRFSLEKSTADCMVLSILRPVTACQSEFACGPFSSILFGGELDSLQCSVLFPKLAPFRPLCLLNDPKLFYVDEMKSGELWYRRSELQSRQHNRNRNHRAATLFPEARRDWTLMQRPLGTRRQLRCIPVDCMCVW
jgi:hypothetical protein